MDEKNKRVSSLSLSVGQEWTSQACPDSPRPAQPRMDASVSWRLTPVAPDVSTASAVCPT